MKKVALLMAALLTVSAFGMTVYAEATEETTEATEEAVEIPETSADAPIVFSYENIDESVYEGVWVSTGLGFDVYLPADWVLVDITEEQAAAGLAFMAGEDGGGANMAVTCTEIPDGYTYDQLYEELKGANTNAIYASLNDIPAIVFENEETMVSGYCIMAENGLITGVISASSNDKETYDAFAPYITNIVSSISGTVTEDAEGEEAAEETEEAVEETEEAEEEAE